MKKVLLLLAILATTGFAYAQKTLSKDYSYTISKPYKVFDGQKFYFSRDGQVMTVKIDGKEAIIQKLDSKGEKVSFIAEKRYEDLPGNTQVEDVLEFGNKYYFFTLHGMGIKIKSNCSPGRSILQKVNSSAPENYCSR